METIDSDQLTEQNSRIEKTESGDEMANAADEFLQLCSDGDQLPDVFEFLTAQEGMTQRAQVDVLLVDQFQRWKHNQVIPVDHYLDRTPDINDVLKVELLLEEFGYLEQRGIAPIASDFANRYSTLSDAAMRELCEGLEIELDSDLEHRDLSGGQSDLDHSSAQNRAEMIGRYEVVRLLGKGAFGKVFLARDPDLNRSVAIKVPTTKRVMMGGGAEEFLNEARAVAKLDHPNIVPVYDCGIDNQDRCFVVSKYVRGKELRAEIRKKICHREAAVIVGQLARALHVAHMAGIVHRDVKPSNVIIDPKRCPHLLDFGLAYQEHDEFNRNAMIGTPAYMSPEQAEGGSHGVDGRSDIYSLGVTFYEVLTGHRPVRTENAEDILAQLKSGPVRPPRQSVDTIPVELERICLKALSKQISSRYSTAKDMADEIETWLIESSSGSGSSSTYGAFGSSDSRRLRSSKKELQQSLERPWIAKIVSPTTLLFAFLVGLAAVIAFTNPPWKVPGSDDTKNLNVADTGLSGDPADLNSVLPEKNKEQRQRLAVLGFRNLSESPNHDWIATGLAELITEELAKSARLELISCENVSLMKADLDIGNTERLGPSALSQIGKRLGTDWVVLGSYSTDPSDRGTIHLSVTVQDSQGDEPPIQFDKTSDRDRLLELVTGVGAQLRKEFVIEPPNVAEPGLLFPSAPDLRAAKDYFEGVESMRSFDTLSAKSSLEKAANVDPKSPLIYDRLAQVLMQLGNERAAREHAAKAVQLSGSLPRVQRLKVEAQHQLLTGEPAKAVTTYRSIFDIRNGALEERLQLSLAMTTAGQGWQALELLGKAKNMPLTVAAKARLDLASAEAAQSVSEFERQVEFSQSAATAASRANALRLQGLALLSEGQARRRLGEHDEALICFDKSVKLLADHGDRLSVATAMAAWGKALVDHGQLNEAKLKIEEGLEIGSQIGNQRLVARLVGQLGEVDIYRGRFDQAESQLRASLDSFQKLGDRQGVADMNLTLANVMARTGKPDVALEMVAAARKAFQESGDRRGEGRTWGQQGAMLGRRGEVIEAQRYFKRALELFREVNDRRSIAICLGDLASTNSNQGRLAKAGELYSEALELHRQMNSQRGPEMVMFNLSNLYARTGRLKESENLMRESLQRYKAQEKWMNACFIERKLADIELRRGEMEKAKKTLAAALGKCREVGSLGVEAQSFYTHCEISLFEGNLEDAKKQILKSQELSRTLKQDLSVASCDLVLARISLRRGLLNEAREFFGKAETTIMSGRPELRPVVLFFRARLDSANEQMDSAMESFEKAEAAISEYSTEDVGVSLLRQFERARALDAIGRTNEAMTELSAIRELARQYGWVAMELEAETLRYEIRSSAGESLDQAEAESFVQSANQLGFSDFAKRIEQLR